MIAGRISEKELVFAHTLHRCNDLLIGTRTPPHIGGVFVTLNGKSKRKITHAQHILAKSVVHQRPVGKSKEIAILIGFAQPYDVFFAHQGLST
ncbi:hypothetical protein SDC9_186552 [bioreactor metagenome]|uniref:Uncharacterized protein n=1 Tax=bioreactor metagenome TaxID=1076179 RepID=A0A645HKA1_9ZZZZ